MMKKRQGCLEYNSAYTLIEVMLVLAIVSVVLIAAQRPLLEFHRILPEILCRHIQCMVLLNLILTFAFKCVLSMICLL